MIPAAPSSECRADLGRVASPNGANDTGSFMSCHTPAKPCFSRSSYNPPHHARTAGSVKSGYTHSPGHTSPRTSSPAASRTKAPRGPTSRPASCSASPVFTAGSTIDTSRTP